MNPSTTPVRVAPAPPARQAPPDILATRRACDAEGTGLSHYILVDPKPRR